MYPHLSQKPSPVGARCCSAPLKYSHHRSRHQMWKSHSLHWRFPSEIFFFLWSTDSWLVAKEQLLGGISPFPTLSKERKRIQLISVHRNLSNMAPWKKHVTSNDCYVVYFTATECWFHHEMSIIFTLPQILIIDVLVLRKMSQSLSLYTREKSSEVNNTIINLWSDLINN